MRMRKRGTCDEERPISGLTFIRDGYERVFRQRGPTSYTMQ